MTMRTARSIVLAALFCAGGAGAQTFTVQSITAGTLGTVAAAASGVTVLQSNANATTTISGGGAYVKGTQTTPLITVNCAGSCNGATARVQVIRNGTNVGRGQTLADIGAVAGAGVTLGGTTSNSSGTLDFTMTGWTGTGTKTFTLGSRLPILGDDSSSATTASSDFKVGVANNPTVPGTFTTSTLSAAAVQKALVIVKNSDLAFGSVVRPSTGNGTVIINNSTGARTAGGPNTPFLIGSGSGRGLFTITGQSASTYSLTVPTSVTMTSGGNNVVVTISATQTSSGSLTLTGGTLSLGIGGSIPITSSSALGAYSGTITISLAYN